MMKKSRNKSVQTIDMPEEKLLKLKEVHQIRDTETEEYESVYYCISENGTVSFNDDDTLSWVQKTNGVYAALKTQEVKGKRTHSPEFLTAKAAELKSWSDNKVYTVVPRSQVSKNSLIIDGRWVCTDKLQSDGTLKPKARFVVRGFKDPYIGEILTDAPTCAKYTLRTMMSICAIEQWLPCSIDIKTAFLQGEEIQRELYITPPKEAGLDKNDIWRLVKPPYGLVDAPRNWYKKLQTVIVKLGGQQSIVDPSFFFWLKSDKLVGMMACHVDDLCYAGVESWKNKILSDMAKEIKIGETQEGKFRYIGINISFYPTSPESREFDITMDQNDYADSIDPAEIPTGADLDSPVNAHQLTELRRLVGSLQWLAGQTCPDLAFQVSALASMVSVATVRQLKVANKLLQRAKDVELSLTFQCITKPVHLRVYADASFGNMRDGATQGGQITVMEADDPNDERVNIIDWTSTKIKRVVRSTFSGETLAMVAAMDRGIILRHMLQQLMYGLVNITLYTDCKSLYDHIHAINNNITEKRLLIDINQIKQNLETGTIKSVKWCSSKEQLADAFTKAMTPHILINIVRQGILPRPSEPQ